MTHIYHCFARMGLKEFDGIIKADHPILDEEGYSSLKQLICDGMDAPPTSSDCVQIISLTLIGTRHEL